MGAERTRFSAVQGPAPCPPCGEDASHGTGGIMESLKGVRVAILVENGFERVEMTEPRKALDQAGAETRLVSPRAEGARGGVHRMGRRVPGGRSARSR